MKLKVLISLVTIGIVGVAVSVGYTTAYFQDVEKSEANVFEAGTLDLVIGEEKDAVWHAEGLLPGNEVEGELELRNDGSLPIGSLLMGVEIE